MLIRDYKTRSSFRKIIKMIKNNLRYILYGIITSIIVFFLFGIPTALIKTSFFVRMIEATALDYFFLISTSILMGMYVGLYFHNRNKKGKICTYSGAFAGLFAVSCPICNTLLVALFGSSAVMLYFEPLRPILGWLAIILLSLGVYYQIKIKIKYDLNTLPIINKTIIR